ncbi:MAG: alkaline phosphatase D family protein [Candidatus Solibacter usitatus]|nr:alkaline phosphatase D family protein [Candidatus Solibacter usitatus]
MTRRQLLAATSAVSLHAAADSGLRHLLPAATHERFLIKASFHQPRRRAPELRVGNRRVSGVRTDSEGQFWMFDVPGLKAATEYALRMDGGDPWTLRTLPRPDAAVDRFRLLVYTCAGGHDAMPLEGSNDPYWVSVPHRRKLFAAALREKPDAMIAIGDHVYWDLRFGRGTGRLPIGQQPWARKLLGADFHRDIPVLGTPNEPLLKRAVDRQIADLYGTLFRSTPVHFIQDDHDYFENDEAIEAGISFPPDDFMTRLARATQHLYFPEHLPNADRPLGLPGASAADRAAGVGECYGTLRAGNLVELLLYDCRRFQTLRGPHARLVPENVEEWLKRRMRDSTASHVVNVPSMPIGWSAGKWGEWYPDVLDDNGRLGTAKPKYFWQQGWRSQHDRLLDASSSMQRIPLFLSGDLHALAHGAIEQNGRADLRRNPVHSVLTGPISTGPRGWPSSARGTPPLIATGLHVRETLAPTEHNGFTLIDFTREKIHFRMFRWKMTRPESELDEMQPFHQFELSR